MNLADSSDSETELATNAKNKTKEKGNHKKVVTSKDSEDDLIIVEKPKPPQAKSGMQC